VFLFISLLTQTFEFIANDNGSLAYLYRLTSGQATRSFAHAAARSANLDEQVIRRALEVIEGSYHASKFVRNVQI
jgi:DNA mismatch repair ATPase MutS